MCRLRCHKSREPTQARWPGFTALPAPQEHHPPILPVRHLPVSTRGIARHRTAMMRQVGAVALEVLPPNPVDTMGIALGPAARAIAAGAHTSGDTIGRMEHTSGATLGVDEQEYRPDRSSAYGSWVGWRGRKSEHMCFCTVVVNCLVHVSLDGR